MRAKRLGTIGSSAISFVVVSVLLGLVSAALLLPVTLVASSATKATANGLSNLPAELKTPPQMERSKVLAADGTELAIFYDENRIYVGLDQISPMMRQAQIAIEDHRFYEHGALDLKATLRALVRNTSGGSTQGGSSITQQYVKMALVEKAIAEGDKEAVKQATETTYARKIQELRYAIAVEEQFSKDEILERYLNIAYYGDGTYGVQAAAMHYFGTTADKLTIDQSAMLAGLVQSPDSVNPVANPRAAIERRNVVLSRMAEVGVISEEQAEQAKAVKWDPSKVSPTRNGCVGTEFPFLCDYVRRTLLNTESLGATPQDREKMLNRGGLVVKTRIDPAAQREAEKSVAKIVGPDDPALGVLVMMQPGTGLITAMAQSRPQMGTGKGQTFYNYAASSSMGGAEGYQAGSTFKAVTLAAALERGIPMSKQFNSTSPQNFKGQTFTSCDGPFQMGNWKVANSTRSAAMMNMRQATNWSVNTYFVHLVKAAGVCNTMKMAEKIGVEQSMGGSLTAKGEACKQDPLACPSWFPSVTLGSLDITPLSMAEAYNTFAGRGKHCEPVILESIAKRDGSALEVPSAHCEQVMPPEVADGVNELLQGVMSSGTGTRVRIPGGYPQAGKTGTTDSNAAVWFAGYTPEMTGVAMIAVDKTHPYWKDKRKSLKYKRLSTGVSLEGSGSGDAGRIYTPAMAKALEGKPKTKFTAVKPGAFKPKMVKVPDVSGLGPQDAQIKLENAGFTVIKVTRYHSSRKGTYLGISPTGTVEEWGNIYMSFSAGPKPKPPPPKPKPTPKETKKPEPKETKKPDPKESKEPNPPKTPGDGGNKPKPSSKPTP
ncbi:transglycosylase domain-containing protein [Enemella sp. A6]|uniref:transglycosylase domain-containing protein n=1 Tax=Enemella sp. A6 TaxID=3440152 RepID=UPI003EBA6865